jgi:hypothetical protein
VNYRRPVHALERHLQHLPPFETPATINLVFLPPKTLNPRLYPSSSKPHRSPHADFPSHTNRLASSCLRELLLPPISLSILLADTHSSPAIPFRSNDISYSQSPKQLSPSTVFLLSVSHASCHETCQSLHHEWECHLPFSSASPSPRAIVQGCAWAFMPE